MPMQQGRFLLAFITAFIADQWTCRQRHVHAHGKRRTVLPASWATRVVWYWYVDWMYSSLPQDTWVAYK